MGYRYFRIDIGGSMELAERRVICMGSGKEIVRALRGYPEHDHLLGSEGEV